MTTHVRPLPPAPRAMMPDMRILAAVALVAVVAAGCREEDRGGFGEPPPASPEVTEASSPSPQPELPPQRVRVRAPGGLRFDPETLEARAGGPTLFTFENADGAEHTFVVNELNLFMRAEPGETVRLPVTLPQDRGRFTFYCAVPGHREGGMAGRIRLG
jgi:plastocyanin